MWLPRLATGSDDTTVRVWDLRVYECVHILYGHTDCVRSVAWLSDGRIVSGAADRTVRVWRVDVEATRACNMLPVQLVHT